MKTVTTPKGTSLPLTNLKGKDYLMVAYRLQWLVEEQPNFDINTDFLSVNDEQTIARAKVTLFDKDGKFIKAATATKRETKKDFSDHTEKAETSAIGRCLAMLGYGTQFALADLDEGDRLADSPLSSPKSETKSEPPVVGVPEEAKKKSFRKPAPAAKVETPVEAPVAAQTPAASASGWD